MVDRYVVQTRIGKIREYVALLRKIRSLADEEHFVKDPLICRRSYRAPLQYYARYFSN